MNNIKIHDSKGKLYYVCPFLERIGEIVGKIHHEGEPIPTEELFEILRHLDSIREIAKHLRGEEVFCGKLHVEKIYEPYNFSAAIKNIKISLKVGNLTEEKIDEITKQYF